MNHSTTIREAAWNQCQNAFAHADAARREAERLQGVAAHFTFCRDEANCFFAADGFPLQLAMSLTGMDGKARRVIVRNEGGEWKWEAENMGGCPFAAWELIEVVKQRIGAKLAGQLTGKVTVN